MLTPNQAIRTLVCGAALLVLAPLSAQAQCKTADALSARLIDQVVSLTTATDPDEVARRNDFGLPSATASQVVLETDSRTCSKALSAYNGTVPAGTGGAPTSVYVVRIGSGSTVRYVVTASIPAVTKSEFAVNVAFDSKFAVVGKFTR